jgi:8-oxo-dGTP pyrophosphatase MutT (NUDIX family)
MKLSPAYVGTILCRENGDFFLVKRIDTIWGNSQWNFPGGLVEEGESIIDAAVRETQEEVGVIVAPEDFRLTHVLDVHKGIMNPRN